MNPSKRFDSLQGRLERVGHKVYESEEKWKVQVGDLLTDLEEISETGKITRETFNDALERARKLGVLGSLNKEIFEKKQQEIEEKRKSGQRVFSPLIESFALRGGIEPRYYTFKFFADEAIDYIESETGKKKTYYSSLANQVFRKLIELRNQVLELEQEKYLDEAWRKEITGHFMRREKLVAGGKYDRREFKFDLKKAQEWGIIKEINEKDFKGLIEEVEKRGETLGCIKFFEWQKNEQGRFEKKTRYFVYDGPTNLSARERAIFDMLQKTFLPAMIEREKKKREREKKRREEGTIKFRKSFGLVEPLLEKNDWRKEIREKVEEKFKEEPERKMESAEEGGSGVKRGKKERRELVRKLKTECNFTDEELQRIRDCADMKPDENQLKSIENLLKTKNIPQDSDLWNKIFEVFKIER